MIEQVRNFLNTSNESYRTAMDAGRLAAGLEWVARHYRGVLSYGLETRSISQDGLHRFAKEADLALALRERIRIPVGIAEIVGFEVGCWSFTSEGIEPGESALRQVWEKYAPKGTSVLEAIAELPTNTQNA